MCFFIKANMLVFIWILYSKARLLSNFIQLNFMPLFAFITILAWAYYGEKATEFCFRWLGDKGKKAAVTVFKIIT